MTRYKHLNVHQFAFYHLHIPLGEWHGDIQNLTERNLPTQLREQHNNKYCRSIVLDSDQYEIQLAVFYLTSKINFEEVPFIFLGDAHQFLLQHLKKEQIPQSSAFSVLVRGNGALHEVVYYNGKYLGSYLNSNDISVKVDERLLLRTSRNSTGQEPGIELEEEWYNLGLHENQLNNWLIENSNLYEKGVINFVPEDIQRFNRRLSLVENYYKSFSISITAIVLVLLVIIAGMVSISNKKASLLQDIGSQNRLRSELTEEKSKHVGLISQLNKAELKTSGRSNHSEMISNYERLLPKSVTLDDLSVFAPLRASSIQHTLTATTNQNDDIYMTLDRLNSKASINSVSLVKTSIKEKGDIQFQLDIQYIGHE